MAAEGYPAVGKRMHEGASYQFNMAVKILLIDKYPKQ
jgi:hypothetical protein